MERQRVYLVCCSFGPLIPAAGTHLPTSNFFAIRASRGATPFGEVERCLQGKATGYWGENPGKAGTTGVSLKPSTSCLSHFFSLIIKTCIENSGTSANNFSLCFKMTRFLTISLCGCNCQKNTHFLRNYNFLVQNRSFYLIFGRNLNVTKCYILSLSQQ